MQIGEIWTHEKYILSNGSFASKHLLVIGEQDSRYDVLYVRLTSRPNGLRDNPRCSLGNPRSGFYLGVPGGPLQQNTWVVFSDVDYLCSGDKGYVVNTRVTIETSLFCELLRCIQQSDDITGMQYNQIGDVIQRLRCP